MDCFSTTPQNNAVNIITYATMEIRNTISMVTRLLSTDFYWFVNLVRVRRLPEEVLLKESRVSNCERESIFGASVSSCGRSQ
jgi:hypothetical protein